MPKHFNPESNGVNRTTAEANLNRMLLIMALVVGLVLTVFYWQERSFQSDLTLQSRSAPSPQPALGFKDITQEAGIGHIHYTGAQGEKLLPETMGGGVAFFDMDNDLDPDLVFVNGCDWAWTEPENRTDTVSSVVLYRNDTESDGPVVYEDITIRSGLQDVFYGMGVVCGDYDGDGLTDLYCTALGENKMYKNMGDGRFKDVTQETGTAGAADAWSTSGCFIDYDEDGDLDLFVCNYVEWNRELDLKVDYQLPGIGRAYGPPMNYRGDYPYLFENQGGKVFVEVGRRAGLHVDLPGSNEPMAKSLGVSPVDIDFDGDMDLVVANDTVRNFVFRNLGDGTFEEAGVRTGLAYDAFGGARGAMGIDTAFINESSSDLAVAIGNFANEMTALYIHDRETLFFSDQALFHGIGDSSRNALTFGVFFFDCDLDGRLDLLTVNGHIEPQIETLSKQQRYAQSAQLYWNQGIRNQGRHFQKMQPDQRSMDLFAPMVGRGSAYADVDGDGDPDVVITQIDGPPRLLRNDLENGNRWIRLKLNGKGLNPNAIGTGVTIEFAGQRAFQRVCPTKGYLSQSELMVTFGLGASTEVNALTVHWGDHLSQVIQTRDVDRVIVVNQP